MYSEAFRKLNGVKYVNWPAYNNEKSISVVSQRIIHENSIQPNDIVGGSSLGGIVAAEISRQINLSKILLIGSTLTPDSVNPILKTFGKYSEIIPLSL
ncbi:hypothetical protein ACFL6N_02240, partial [Thermodesulfobacteriota bacterium]